VILSTVTCGCQRASWYRACYLTIASPAKPVPRLICSSRACNAVRFCHGGYLLPPVAAGWLEDWGAAASSLASQLCISSTSFDGYARPTLPTADPPCQVFFLSLLHHLLFPAGNRQVNHSVAAVGARRADCVVGILDEDAWRGSARSGHNEVKNGD
jgi:hypothetical protein